jgi:hypothetical protein
MLGVFFSSKLELSNGYLDNTFHLILDMNIFIGKSLHHPCSPFLV